MNKDEIEEILNSAYFYLKFRPRTKKEVVAYLNKKATDRSWSEEGINKAVESLEKNKYIDDSAFTEWFVNSRNSSKPKGEYVLRGELMRMGVERELLDKYFIENKPDDTEMAYRAIASKWSRMGDLHPKERFRKVAALLQRRGFSWETIKKVVDKLEENK